MEILDFEIFENLLVTNIRFMWTQYLEIVLQTWYWQPSVLPLSKTSKTTMFVMQILGVELVFIRMMPKGLLLM